METKEPTAAEMLGYIKGDKYIGSLDAPITMIMYDAFSCFHCAALNKNSLPQIIKNYADTGKVLVISRYFPMERHSLLASIAVECYSRERNNYFKVKGIIFENQNNWLFQRDPKPALANILGLLGLPKSELDACFEEKDLQNKIVEDKINAVKLLNVDATPTIFINGTRYEGYRDYDFFKSVFDNILLDYQYNYTNE
jgi:protein-disulfide isomerase